jgi:hypothetical protein
LGSIVILIGDLGGGKTTLARYLSLLMKAIAPHAVQVVNTQMDGTYKVEDANKFIAIKLIKKDKRYALVIEDEAAQAGLESRGSGTKGQALESRVVTLARKAHVDLMLISQLLSMIDKRAQWLGNLYVLCEAVWLEDNPTPFPDYFEYTVFDSKLREIGGFELDFVDCVQYIFPYMDTDDIPYGDKLKEQWEKWYGIRKCRNPIAHGLKKGEDCQDCADEEYEEFERIMVSA